MHRPSCTCFLCKNKLSRSNISRLAKINFNREEKQHDNDFSNIEAGAVNTNSFIIEGTLRLQDNLVSCKKKYGSVFIVDVVKMDGDFYFSQITTLKNKENYLKGDKDIVYALVSQDEERLILGKFRYPYDFTTCKIMLNEDKKRYGDDNITYEFETYPNDKTKNRVTTVNDTGLLHIKIL